jgi:hypothetical protein
LNSRTELYQQTQQIDKAGGSQTLLATHAQYLTAHGAGRPDVVALVPVLAAAPASRRP